MSAQPAPYSEIAKSAPFRQLLERKKRFILPATLFFLCFYFVLPILTSYSKVLNTPAFGSVSWAWILAFCQFVMTWVLCSLYSRKSVEFDRMVDEISGSGKQPTNS